MTHEAEPMDGRGVGGGADLGRSRRAAVLDWGLLVHWKHCWPDCVVKTCGDDYCPKPPPWRSRDLVSAVMPTIPNACRGLGGSVASNATTIEPSASRG